ncbi:MAG: hypothetical protein LLG42_14880, partial [Chloroflexi bacterium]|nr:hypothetical protein [Chloroflexota bacterium]
MRKYEYPYYADWYAISLRWLGLVGGALSLVRAGIFNDILAIAILVGVIWNLACTILSVLNRRLGAHRSVNVLIDYVVTTVLFLASQGLYGPLSWIGLLNMISAGIYFGWTGSLIMAIIISMTQLLGSVWILHIPVVFQQAAMLTGFNLLAGLAFGVLADKLYQQLRERYFEVKKDRMETEEQLRLRERHRMQNLFQLVDTINASLNYMTVLQTALDLSHDILTEKGSREDARVSIFLLFDGTHLKVTLD